LFGRKSLATRLWPGNPLSSRYLVGRNHQDAAPFDVDSVSGACLLVRAEAVRQVGLLDERFFIYWEDTDWCRRFRQAGWRVSCIPSASVIHHEGVSSGPYRKTLIIEFHRSVYRYFCKHHARGRPWLAFLAGVALTARATGLLLAHVVGAGIKRITLNRDQPSPTRPGLRVPHEGKAAGRVTKMSLAARVLDRIGASHHLRRMPRHLRSVVHHSTPRRLANLLLVETERKLGLARLRGRPYVIFVDPINLCSLKCPLCATGNNEITRVQSRMDLEHFKRVIDAVAPWAYEVSLYNWGEPLLHRDIFHMIRYAKERNLATLMSSHLSLRKQELMDRLIEAGLGELTVSLDGVTQDVYEKYRVGGNLELVLRNLRYLLERRRELGSPTPVIEWQFIVFKHNEHQMDQARQMARDLGVDLIRFIPAGLPFDADPEKKQRLAKDWFSTNPELRYQDPAAADFKNASFRQKGGCYYLYRSMTVNPDGAVSPCCIVYNDQYDFGNVLKDNVAQDNFTSLWNNDYFRSARSEFSRIAVSPGKATVCKNCQIFDKPRAHVFGTGARAVREPVRE
jgi:radical SAM protein with 4Fe4S-binding SPASM domain